MQAQYFFTMEGNKRKIKPTHLKFIQDVAQGAIIADAYLLHVAPNKEISRTSARNAGARLSTKYSDLIEAERTKLNALAIQAQENDKVSAYLSQVASYAEKRAKLAAIIRGEIIIEEERVFQLKDGTIKRETVKVLPSLADIIRAIDADNKMSGDLAPEKIQIDKNVRTISIIAVESRHKGSENKPMLFTSNGKP